MARIRPRTDSAILPRLVQEEILEVVEEVAVELSGRRENRLVILGWLNFDLRCEGRHGFGPGLALQRGLVVLRHVARGDDVAAIKLCLEEVEVVLIHRSGDRRSEARR